jgi:predicted PurR-regulated permease PerM
MKLPAEVRRRIDQSLLDAGDRVEGRVRESVVAGVGLVASLPWLVLMPVLAFFLLKNAESLRQSALNAQPQRFHGRGYRLFEEPNATLAACIRAQLLGCVLVGTVCGA